MPQIKRPFICDCGDPAISKDSCHNPVCERCRRMEAVRKEYGKKETSGVEDEDAAAYKHTTKKRWDARFADDVTPILLPDALARVEAILKRAECQPIDNHHADAVAVG